MVKNKSEYIKALLLCFDACVEFTRKCEAGEAKSTRSYNQMKVAIESVRAHQKASQSNTQ